MEEANLPPDQAVTGEGRGETRKKEGKSRVANLVAKKCQT